MRYLVPLIVILSIGCSCGGKVVPGVITTWSFTCATEAAWKALNDGKSPVDAVEIGCTECEKQQCDGTVGFGGSPDENGETTLDAMIFDGTAMDMGAVGALRNIKDAISVAKNVLKNTKHSMLVGSQATAFAVQMGYKNESLSTCKSTEMFETWKKANCQPNNWKDVTPDSKTKCGPYKPQYSKKCRRNLENMLLTNEIGPGNHDTIGMIAVDSQGNVAAGTSTNGMCHKIPGRVGDSPIPGAGGYADSDVGGAAATGDGDVMMRFLPSFVAVEEMRRGMKPAKAAWTAIDRIVKKYPDFSGAVVAINKRGDYGAACNGMSKFTYNVVTQKTGKVALQKVACEK